MTYRHLVLQESIKIDGLTNICVHTVGRNYVYPGESHDFWEMHYVRRGSVFVHAQSAIYMLEAGEVTLYPPDKFHVVYGNGDGESEYVVVSFHSNSLSLGKIAGKIFGLTKENVMVLEQIVQESERSFENIPMDGEGYILHRRAEVPFGAEQLIQNGLENFLIGVYRQSDGGKTYVVKQEMIESGGLASAIREYLEKNVFHMLTLQSIAAGLGVSVSQIKKAYRQEYASSIIADFNEMKVDCAKQLLEDSQGSIQEIAAALSYKNVYYFSNCFKKYTGLSPSEYRKQRKNPEIKKR